MTIHNDAEALRAAVATAIPLPAGTRTYVSHNAPAWDCAQLVVHVDALRVVPAGGPHCAVARDVDFVITYLACVTGLTDEGEPPAADVLDAEASALLTAAENIWSTVTRGMLDGTIMDVNCRSVTISDLAPVGPEGGLAGWTMTVTVRM